MKRHWYRTDQTLQRLPASVVRRNVLASLLLAGVGLSTAARGTVSWPSGSLYADPYRLVDQDNRPVQLDRFSGKPLVLSFFFTGCSSVCPTAIQQLALLQQAMRSDPAGATQLVSVTVDPLHDTAPVIKAYGRVVSADFAQWSFLTGRPEPVDRLIQRLHALDPRVAQPGPADHTTQLYLFDGQGLIRQRFQGVPLDQRRVLREIAQLKRLEGHPDSPRA